MKRITEIEFTNYKAFFQSGEENKINIPNGKSVLIYGENGSGKSSVYEGLKQFFNSSDNTLAIIPSRHIAVPKTRTEKANPGTPEEVEREVTSEVSVKITFTDNTGSEQKIFGIPNSNVQGTNYIAQANLLNSFLSYRELLRTYLMDDLRDRTEFRRKFANLLIENILAKQINTVTQTSYISSWERLFIPRARYKEENLAAFANGLKLDILRINLILNEILKYFEPNLEVQLIFAEPYIDYVHSAKQERTGKHPICEIDLNVKLFGLETQNEEENHLTVLNEARLSALAISIYIASLINTPQSNFDFKILFLDDIFIGLDMSNRLPLLEILKNFKKPVIEQFVDSDNDNTIVERIQRIGSVMQTDAEPFFKDYQIFISTYDRFWFQVAKNWFETKSKDKWYYLELFAHQKPTTTFNTPLVLTSLDFVERANYYYKRKEYPECVNNLRKALEARLKILLPPNKHFNEYEEVETGEKLIKPLRTLNEYLTAFIKYCSDNGIDATELIDLKNLKDWYFNPFSHDNIGTPIFTRELDIAKNLVQHLGKFEFTVLLPASSNLFFRFDNNAGKVWEYKLELRENLRWIKSADGNILTNPKIRCYEKSIDGITTEVNWIMSGDIPWSLMKFFTNKWHQFIENEEAVPMERIWNEVIQLDNGQALVSLATPV